jgi:hypothetical protein
MMMMMMIVTITTTTILSYITRKEQIRYAYTILFGKPEGKRPYGRRGHRWEWTIRPLVNTINNLRILMKGREFLDLLSDY